MKECVLVVYKRGLMDGIALAIENAFSDGSLDIVCVDEEEIGGRSGLKGYVRAIRHCPKLSGLYLKRFYKKYRIKKYREVSAEKERKLKFIGGVMQAMEKAENVLYRFHPKAVICTTSKSLALMIAAKRNTGCMAPVCGCIYDFTESKGLIDKQCDRYMVATHEMAAKLSRCKIDDSAISVTGFPVSVNVNERKEARAKIGIKDELPVVAVIGGRYGNKAAKAVAQWLSAYSTQMHVVAVGGAGRRSNAKAVVKDGVTILGGARENIECVYSACDIAVVSPTPFIVAECAALRIPIALIAPNNFREKAAFNYLIDGGYCLPADTQLRATASVQDLLMDNAYYMNQASKIGQLCESGGSEGVRQAVEKMVSENKGDVFGRDIDDKIEQDEEGGDIKENQSQDNNGDSLKEDNKEQPAEEEIKGDNKGFSLFRRKK